MKKKQGVVTLNFKWKKRYTAAVIAAIVGAILTVLTYFATDIYQKDEVAVITDSQIKDTLIEKMRMFIRIRIKLDNRFYI